jgi:hypothetical protein
MKTCVLFGTVIVLLSGCLHHSPYYYNHEVTITLKNGLPCFGLADDEQVRSEQVKIYSINVQHGVSGQLPVSVMGKMLDDITLRSGECIPYEGETIKNNLLYGIGFSVFVENQSPNEVHGYGGSFCLSENKNGERVLHHFKERERPTSCPVSSGE